MNKQNIIYNKANHVSELIDGSFALQIETLRELRNLLSKMAGPVSQYDDTILGIDELEIPTKTFNEEILDLTDEDLEIDDVEKLLDLLDTVLKHLNT